MHQRKTHTTGCTIAMLATALLAAPVFAQSATLASQVATDEARLIDLFKKLHANPELSMQETETAALLAKEFKANGFEVQTGINKTGVVGILRNGPGPVILFRGDMDALPVKEETGLSYASTKTGTTLDGIKSPITHACGHDAHVTWLIGVAKVMAAQKANWSGTLILVGQPAEEAYMGAKGMIDDGLYPKIPEPSVVFASHTNPLWPAGSVGLGQGRRMAGADQMVVTLKGVGGHGSTPHASKDPIVMSAQAILAYQTIISRRIDQTEPVVLTVGAINSGTVGNIIPDSATMRLSLRWYNPDARDQMVAMVKQTTDAIAVGNGMPADRMPVYENIQSITSVTNDDELVLAMRPVLAQALGKENVYPGTPMQMGSEDFQMLGDPIKGVKILHMEVGVAKPEVLKAFMENGSMPPYMNHHPKFQVELPAIAAGVKANAAVLLELLKK
ncbi:MAG: amidohydrolase [Arenimonas sp.]|nr:amidohydrolase [Arenimonas sp.]